ncbi:MAG TPA: hypothetical protein DD725_11890 [Deltaproteobacteria bacterium]|nr:MAG: hypothetical protein A2Z89_08210 [Deltaproteobacteria bacterium GWA2_43_19]HBR18280.1 hypothetical protein [Deltaproteobacteria bacterium]
MSILLYLTVAIVIELTDVAVVMHNRFLSLFIPLFIPITECPRPCENQNKTKKVGEHGKVKLAG